MSNDFFQVYDPKTNTWTESIKMTGYRLSFCTRVSKNEKEIYVVGGIDQNGQKKRLEKLDLESMTWSQLPDMANNRSSLGCAIFGNSLIAAGGWGNLNDGPNPEQIAPIKTAEYFDFTLGIDNIQRIADVVQKVL